jgi:hypothetical protein
MLRYPLENPAFSHLDKVLFDKYYKEAYALASARLYIDTDINHTHERNDTMTMIEHGKTYIWSVTEEKCTAEPCCEKGVLMKFSRGVWRHFAKNDTKNFSLATSHEVKGTAR